MTIKWWRVLLIGFIALKLTGLVAWSWWWALLLVLWGALPYIGLGIGSLIIIQKLFKKEDKNEG